MVAPKDIYQLLLDKVPTFRTLEKVESQESGEPLVQLHETDELYVINLGAEMRPYTNDHIFVRRTLRDKLLKAAQLIVSDYPDLMLQVHYGYRHPQIQRERYNQFMEKIKNDSSITDKPQYAHTFVAHPKVAGHPTGGAVDVTLISRHAKEPIEMGTELREFCEHTLTFCPFISSKAWRNRQILRTAMIGAGFAPYDGEWWHYSYGDKEWAYFFNHPYALYGVLYHTDKDIHNDT